MNKLLLVLFFTAMGMFEGLSQALVQTYVDRCTGQVNVFTVPMNGQTVVAFYNRSRRFTSQDFQDGTLHAWLEETYLWWISLSPCSSTTTGAQATQQTTQQTTQQATQAATNAASTAAANTTTNVPSTPVSTPPVTQTSQPTTTTPDTSSTNTVAQNTTTSGGNTTSQGNNTSTSAGSTSSQGSNQSNTSSNNSSSGTENTNTEATTEASSTETSNTESGNSGSETKTEETKTESTQESSSESTTEESSTEEVSTEESSTEETTTEESTEETSTEESTEESSSEESTEESSEESSEESTEEESTDEQSEEESTEEESSEESEESESEESEEESDESSEEESEEEDTEEESESDEEEDSEEEESEEESSNEDEEEDDEKKKKKRNLAPPIVTANAMAQQMPTGEYQQAVTLGISQSSLMGTETYGLNLMVYDNLQQYMLNANYSKVNINKEGRVNRVYSASLGAMKMFTTYMGMMNHSWTFLGEKGSVAGVAFGTSITLLDINSLNGQLYLDTSLLGFSLTSFYTKPIQYNPKLTISPMVAVSSPFLQYEMYQRETFWNKDIMVIAGASFTYKLTQRFGLNFGANIIESTAENFPTMKTFTIGGRLSF